MEATTWNDSTHQWEASLTVLGRKATEYGASYTVTSDFAISAVGQLNVPRYPNITGLDSLQDRMMYSARWDPNYDLKGKKVAMISNGATAAQILPEIVNIAQGVTVFQRSPNWIMP